MNELRTSIFDGAASSDTFLFPLLLLESSCLLIAGVDLKANILRVIALLSAKKPYVSKHNRPKSSIGPGGILSGIILSK